MNRDIERILITEEELKIRVKAMGQQITRDFKDDSLLIICILKGSSIFFADLIREIDCDVQIAFISAASYGSKAVSSGKVEMTNIMEIPIEDRSVLLVEDIVDTGRTIAKIKESFLNERAVDVRIATLLDKPERRLVESKADYIGFTIPDEFVVGYGLDYDQRYRNLPYVGVLKHEVYDEK